MADLQMKTVAQLDADNHWFLGATDVDEDPKNPGEFLMPPNTLDVPIPEEVVGKRCWWDAEHEVFVYEDLPTPNLDAIKATMLAAIDNDVDMIYARAIGFRGVEYEHAEQEALAYAAAGFTGDIPVTVVDWADISDRTPQAAAEDIIQQAALWRGLSAAMRPARLRAKADTRAAATKEEAAVIESTWKLTVAGWHQALGF